MTAEHVAGNRSRENYRTGVPVNQRPSEKDRWPATILHDGSDEVITAFPDSAGQQGDVKGTEPSTPFSGVVYGEMAGRFEAVARNDGEGSSARFFNSFPGRDSDVKRIHYDSKASADMRVGSDHPTVKNIDLMQWLVRLVTPIGGTTIDPFAGTGTTGEAAYREGLSAILIEREPTYQQDIRRRMALVLAGPDERSRESLKASGKVESVDTLPLFGGKDEQS